MKTDVKHGSGDAKNDIPTMQNYQNIINTGGVCGRRAFFGRFILRCFGIPTVARPQPGHATLAHWSPDGWVICLGATRGFGSINGNPDRDFLASTRARKDEQAYLMVQCAQWAGDVLGEKRASGFRPGLSGLWNAVTLYRQRAIIEAAIALALAAVGTDIGMANESKVKESIQQVLVADTDKQVVTGTDGTITVPAVACTSPNASTDKIVFMKSHPGGMQLHYYRMGTPAAIDYAVDAPQAGKYALRARLVTVSPDQHLFVAADAKEPVDIALPCTVGKWEQSPPVEVVLAKGKNVLRITRNEPGKGVSIKDFTPAPMK